MEETVYHYDESAKNFFMVEDDESIQVFNDHCDDDDDHLLCYDDDDCEIGEIFTETATAPIGYILARSGKFVRPLSQRQ